MNNYVLQYNGRKAKLNNKTAIVLIGFMMSIIIITILVLITALENKPIRFLDQKTIPDMKIPSWVKHTAGWWSEDRISDKDYTTSIQYLIDHGIIKLK